MISLGCIERRVDSFARVRNRSGSLGGVMKGDLFLVMPMQRLIRLNLCVPKQKSGEITHKVSNSPLFGFIRHKMHTIFFYSVSVPRVRSPLLLQISEADKVLLRHADRRWLWRCPLDISDMNLHQLLSRWLFTS